MACHCAHCGLKAQALPLCITCDASRSHCCLMQLYCASSFAVVCRQQVAAHVCQSCRRLLVMPVVQPHHSSPTKSEDAQAGYNSSQVPGLPCGQATGLPVIAVLVFGWSIPDGGFGGGASLCATPGDGGAAGPRHAQVDPRFEQDQVAYMLAEQASMALWACLRSPAAA
jgi:hypothetical protein